MTNGENAGGGSGNRYDQIPKFWDDSHRNPEYYEYYLTGSRGEDVWTNLGIGSRIRPGAAVLNIGVGLGHCTRALAERGCDVSALDISPVALERVRGLASALYLPERLPDLPGGSFDLAISHLVAQHMENEGLREQLRHVIRALKPEGVLAIQISTSLTPGENDLDPTPPRRMMSGAVFRSLGFMERMVGEAGGCIVRADRIGIYPEWNIVWYALHVVRADSPLVGTSADAGVPSSGGDRPAESADAGGVRPGEERMVCLQGLDTRDLQFLLMNAIGEADSVLEIGCGVGDYLAKYTRPDQRVAAAEPYLPYLERARERAPWVRFENLDGLAYLDSSEERFDCVLLIDVIEHLVEDDARRLVEGAIRRAGKILVCQTPYGVHEQHDDPWGMGGGYWQTHRTTWDNRKLDRLGFSFYTVWKGWFKPEGGGANKSEDVVMAFWMDGFDRQNFTVIVPVDSRTPASGLVRTVESLLVQSWPKFRVAIAADGPSGPVERSLAELRARDSRVSVFSASGETGVAELGRLAEGAPAGFLAVMQPGETIPPNGLEARVRTLSRIGALPPFAEEAGFDSYREALRRATHGAWQKAWAEGRQGGMGDHRLHPYDRYIRESGFYRDVAAARNVVEFAPGDGSFIEPLVRGLRDKTFWLVEVSEENLLELYRKFESDPNVALVMNDRGRLPIDGADVAFSFLLCQSTPRTLWFDHLCEVRRELRPGGAYVFQFAWHPSGRADDSIPDAIGGSHKYAPEEMLALAADAGFDEARLFGPIDLTAYGTDILWYLCRATRGS